jgi:aspartate aminotransferase
MLAQRLSLITRSGTAATRAALGAARAGGLDIVDLAGGQIALDPPAALVDAAIAALRRGVAGYTDTLGLPELREVLAACLTERTGGSWSSRELAVTAGAKQALAHIATAILNPGDEVIVPSPSWPTFAAQIALAGARAVAIRTAPPDWLPDVHDIQAALTARTRAIIVNSPHNPTGAVYGARLLRQIADIALSNKLWVVHDAAYEGLVYSPGKHVRLLDVAPDLQPRLLHVGSFSKRLAIPGWRLGYLGAPAEVINAVGILQAHSTSNPSVIAQQAILDFLSMGSSAFEGEVLQHLQHNRQRALSVIGALDDVSAGAAQGGFYLYLDVSRLLGRWKSGRSVTSADDLAALLAHAGVGTVSGTVFGDPAGLRLSYGARPDDLERGLARMAETLDGLQQTSRHGRSRP